MDTLEVTRSRGNDCSALRLDDTTITIAIKGRYLQQEKLMIENMQLREKIVRIVHIFELYY